MPFSKTTSNYYPDYVPQTTESPWWTSGEQPVPHSSGEQLGNLAITGLAVGGLYAFGRRQFDSNTRGFDLYIKAIRGLEEYSPGRIFRTFQLSYLLSPAEAQARTFRYFSPELLTKMLEKKDTREWLEYHSRLTGRDLSIVEEGFRFEKGKLLAGKTGTEELLSYAKTVRNPIAADPKLMEAYGRSLKKGPWGMLKGAFTERIPFISETGKISHEPFAFIGGATRGQATKRALSGYGTSLVERFNQLVRSPFELPIISDVLKRTPIINKLSLSVIPSSGLKTLGAMTFKLGILAPAAYLSYKTLDWAARTSEIFDDTILGEGITAGLATVWTGSQLAASRVAETLGLHSFRERQEAIAPGSTEVGKLLAFPILGGLGGVGVGYAHRIFSQFSAQKGLGLGAQEVSHTYQAAMKFFVEKSGGEEVPEDFLRLLSPGMRTIAEEKAERLSASRWGKMARWLVDQRKSESVVRRLVGGLYKKPSISRMLGWTGFFAGIVAISPFLPGALIPGERPEELEALYSGEQEVPIRKGRFWEMGPSAWKGSRVQYFRPHWYPRMLARAKEKSIYGEEDISPWEQWWMENFTYDIERKHYYDRPYPLSSPAFSEVPILGPILGATIGRLVKPPLLMHTDEWVGGGGVGSSSGGGDLTKRMPLDYGGRLEIAELGELEEGAPISPHGVKGVLGQQVYNMTELFGLPGFTAISVKEAITGSQDLFDQEMQLASAGRIYSPIRGYWDLNLGGMAGTSEGMRRLYPHSRRQIPLYNPLKNTMPEWLPGAGDKSINFQIGDPFAAIQEGEMRLPGVGFEAHHPEVAGMDPEDYPDIWKLKILADVAPYSEKYGRMLGRVRLEKNRGDLSDVELEMYNTLVEQIKEKKTRKEFYEYQYRDRTPSPAEETLTRINEAFKEKGDVAPSIFERALGSYWETIAHGAETPLEFITPISPVSKLIHMRTAIEDYERTSLYGRESSFWQHPITDFMRPFAYSSAHALGWEGIPAHEQRRRDTESYFDVLKYVKFTRLKNMAVESGDLEAIKEYEGKRRETAFGINPYTYNYTYLFRSLPRRERDYFNEFIKADLEGRKKIFSMVPENEKSLYAARWHMEDVGNWREAIKIGGLTEREEEQAQGDIARLEEYKKTEGYPIDNNLWEQYKSTRQINETYPDWYRRTKLLPRMLEDKNLPGPCYVGWDPRVRLQDIKLKVIQDLGESPFDYDIWPDTVRAAARRPYLDEAAEELYDDQLGESEIREQLEKLLSAHGVSSLSVSSRPIYGGQKPQIDLTIEEDRSFDIRKIIQRRGMN